MLATVVNCIYCSKAFDPTRGEGDHIIPAQLGEFRNDVRFRRVCPSCNNRIGRSEQQFLQCGPESFFRDIVKPAAPKSRRRGRSRIGGALGMPSPEFTMDSGDHNQLVLPQSDRPKDAESPDQLVIRDDEGRDHFFRLFSGMRPSQLRERVESAGINDFPKAWLHCDGPRWDEFGDLVQAAWPEKKLHELPGTDPGVYKVRGRITFRVNEHYFRAIAKIAFHYYLAHSRRGVRGDEPGFEAIRRFIMEGGEIDEFFQSSQPRFFTPFDQFRTYVPHQWCHLLAADETRDFAVAYVSLFLGPDHPGKPHQVVLGLLNSKLEIPGGAWGHVYLYDQTQSTSGYAGHVEQAFVRRIR